MRLASSRGISALAVALATSACADFSTFKQPADLEKTSYSMDAKQRVIVSLAPAGKSRSLTGRYICAEPSPDAVSAIAASGALEAQIPGQGGGAVSASMNEAVASMAIRTATIQMLRDGLYRACEAYMNGAIDDFGYALLLNRYDNIMISLLAIEGMTGMRPAAQPAIGTETTAKATGKQDTTTPAGAGSDQDVEPAAGPPPAATVKIESGAESSAKVTTVEFSAAEAPDLSKEAVEAVGPHVAKIVDKMSQGSSTLGACMMWIARQTDADLASAKAQKLVEYCDWRRGLLDLEASPQAACMRWLASAPSAEDPSRGKICGPILQGAARDVQLQEARLARAGG